MKIETDLEIETIGQSPMSVPNGQVEKDKVIAESFYVNTTTFSQ